MLLNRKRYDQGQELWFSAVMTMYQQTS